MIFIQIYAADFTTLPAQNPLSDSGNWTLLSGLSADPLQILNQQCTFVNDPDTFGSELLSGPSLNADQYCEFTIGTHSDGTIAGYVRSNNRSSAGIQLIVGNGFWQVLDRQNGNTVILSGTKPTTAGDVWRLAAYGTTVQVFWNGISQGSVTDSAPVLAQTQVLNVFSASDLTHIGITKYAAGNVVNGGIVSGNIGVAGATVGYSGTASGSVQADGTGSYSIGLPNGSYTITPSLAGWTFSPTSQNETVSGSDITGVNFTAALTWYSVPDCRDYGTFPNSPVNVQGTLTYTVPVYSLRWYFDKFFNRTQPLPVDSRAAGAPVDSRNGNIPENSRTNPPF